MNKIRVVIVVMVLLLMVGCQAEPQKAPVKEPIEEEVVEVVVVPEPEPEPEEEEVVEEPVEEPEEEVELYEGPTYLLTGLPDLDEADQRPVAVMIDNHIGARPQSGISRADIVYEILAEGSITRYMAIFQSDLPEHIGPVRSARPYFISKALEFDAMYVHVGGSMQALTDIKQLNMADVDGMSSSASTFWRESHKRIPHNMYTSGEEINKWANKKGYRSNYTVDFMSFNPIFIDIEGDQALEMAFTYKQPTNSDTVGYTSSYVYDEEGKVYTRYVNGEVHVDENDQTPITCTNVLVQFAKTRVIDNEGRREITLSGSGKGKYYTGGKVIDVTWEKYDRRAETVFYTTDGQEIMLNPGKTWIQVVPTGFEIN